jgi:hypothetical protein
MLVKMMQAPGTSFDLACLADVRAATALVAGLEERGVSGSMRFEVHTAYLRVLGYLQRHCTWAPVSEEVISLLMDTRQVAAADRKKESRRSRRRTIQQLVALGRWLLLPQRKALQSALVALLQAAVDRPPATWESRLAFGRVMMTWLLVCQDHPTPRVQVQASAAAGQDRTGQARTGQDRTGQDRTGLCCAVLCWQVLMYMKVAHLTRDASTGTMECDFRMEAPTAPGQEVCAKSDGILFFVAPEGIDAFNLWLDIRQRLVEWKGLEDSGHVFLSDGLSLSLSLSLTHSHTHTHTHTLTHTPVLNCCKICLNCSQAIKVKAMAIKIGPSRSRQTLAQLLTLCDFY